MHQGLSQEKLFSLQRCSWEKDESSLDFTMLLRLESLFPFFLSPPLAGGNIAILLGSYSPGSWLLYSASLPDSWGSGLLRLSSLLWLLWTFLTLSDFLDFLVSWTLYGLVVLHASCSLPDSCDLLDSLGLQTLKAVIFILKTLYFFQSRAC